MVPAGTPHVWGNPSEEEAHLIAELRPALRLETWFETFFGLTKDGKVDPKNGLPNRLQWAVIAREYEDEIYLASPPLFVQRVLYGLLAPIGKLLGSQGSLPRVQRPGGASGTSRRKGRRAPVGGFWGDVGSIVVGAGAAAVALLVLRRRFRSGRR
jgi:hypothetical protein